MTKILFAVLESLRELNPVVTLLSAGLTFVVALFNFFNSMWAELVAKLAYLVLPNYTAGLVVEGLSFLNYFFPLEEFFSFFSVYLGLFVVCAAIRIVKSFIPTIS
jgi:hypothetical protein